MKVGQLIIIIIYILKPFIVTNNNSISVRLLKKVIYLNNHLDKYKLQNKRGVIYYHLTITIYMENSRHYNNL